MRSIYRKHLRTTALIWAGCCALFLLIYITALAPQKESSKWLETLYLVKKQAYESAQVAARDETKSELNKQIERLQDRLRDFVIDLENSVDLTFDISQLAKEKEVTSFSISSVKGKDGRTDSEIPGCEHIGESFIKVSFNAGFNHFASLLNALERHRPVLFVDKCKITCPEQGGSNHSVNMELAVFVRKKTSGGTPNAI